MRSHPCICLPISHSELATPPCTTTTTTTDLLSLSNSNTEHYRDYESVFIVPGPSCHNQNRKQTFLQLLRIQSFLSVPLVRVWLQLSDFLSFSLIT